MSGPAGWAAYLAVMTWASSPGPGRSSSMGRLVVEPLADLLADLEHTVPEEQCTCRTRGAHWSDAPPREQGG